MQMWLLLCLVEGFPDRGGSFHSHWSRMCFLALCGVTLFCRHHNLKQQKHIWTSSLWSEWDLTSASIQVHDNVLHGYKHKLYIRHTVRSTCMNCNLPVFTISSTFEFLPLLFARTLIIVKIWSEMRIFISMCNTCGFSSTVAYKLDIAGTVYDLQLIILYHYWISRTPGSIF